MSLKPTKLTPSSHLQRAVQKKTQMSALTMTATELKNAQSYRRATLQLTYLCECTLSLRLHIKYHQEMTVSSQLPS